MDKLSVIASVVMIGSMLVLFGPQIFAFNRGKILENIALWLMIFTGLTLIYRNFGPGSAHPMFSAPAITMSADHADGGEKTAPPQ